MVDIIIWYKIKEQLKVFPRKLPCDLQTDITTYTMAGVQTIVGKTRNHSVKQITPNMSQYSTQLLIFCTL